MRLFDEKERERLGPSKYAESLFSFLNESAKPEVQRIRDLLEQWFSNFPVSEKAILRQRFRSDDRGTLAVFLELYSYALLINQGFNADIHPPAAQEKQTHPDFVVLKNDEPVFYMESTLAARADLDPAEEAILNQIYDALNCLESPNFFIGVRIEEKSVSTPSISKICSFVKEKLEQLNPDDVPEIITDVDFDSLPRWLWSSHGWKLVFFPIYKPLETRGKPGVRPIGLEIYEPEWIDPRKTILNALKEKATRYGLLDRPYVVTINATSLFTDEMDVTDALFGREHLIIDRQAGSAIPARAPDGFWIGPKGPQNTRVSAVLIAIQLLPWTVSTHTPTLWHNPWAEKPLGPELWQGPQMVLDHETSTMELLQGKNASEIFRLDPSWPREKEAA